MTDSARTSPNPLSRTGADSHQADQGVGQRTRWSAPRVGLTLKIFLIAVLNFMLLGLVFAAFLRLELRQPLVATETEGQFDVVVLAHGGGVHGQAGAVRHGIARALLLFNPELRSKLRQGGFLTRDPRAKERKKYGQKGARKRFQFSKR